MYGDEKVPMPYTSSEISKCQPTLTERIKRERDEVAARLADLDAALQALEASPEVKKVLDLVQKVARY
jgi:hypothetical protein